GGRGHVGRAAHRLAGGAVADVAAAGQADVGQVVVDGAVAVVVAVVAGLDVRRLGAGRARHLAAAVGLAGDAVVDDAVAVVVDAIGGVVDADLEAGAELGHHPLDARGGHGAGLGERHRRRRDGGDGVGAVVGGGAGGDEDGVVDRQLRRRAAGDG